MVLDGSRTIVTANTLLPDCHLNSLLVCRPYRLVYPKCSQRNMYGKSWILALAPALLVALFLSPSSASTVCNASLYGSPNPIDCLRILLDDHKAGTYGLESIDRKDHFFYTMGFDQRPSDVTRAQWRNKVHLAQTTHRG